VATIGLTSLKIQHILPHDVDHSITGRTSASAFRAGALNAHSAMYVCLRCMFVYQLLSFTASAHVWKCCVGALRQELVVVAQSNCCRRHHGRSAAQACNNVTMSLSLRKCIYPHNWLASHVNDQRDQLNLIVPQLLGSSVPRSSSRCAAQVSACGSACPGGSRLQRPRPCAVSRGE
jgi:hypothetical protein